MTKGEVSTPLAAAPKSLLDAVLQAEPAPAAVPAAAAANRGLPAAGATGAEHDDAAERDAVFSVVKRFSKASWARACFDLAQNLALYWLAFSYREHALAVLVAGLLRVRLFVVFHDCAHGAFFPSARANRLVGSLLGPLNHVSYSFWSRGHNHHHRHSNNTKYGQFSQSSPLTLAAYEASTPYQRFVYRMTYTPFAFLFLMPTLTFVVFFTYMGRWFEAAMNAAYFYAAWYYGLLGWDVATWVVASAVGFYMFHMQHTFEGSHRWTSDKWSYFENGMSASSFLQVPWFLQYFTGNIEYHHIHHLSPLVPMYRLPQCHAAAGALFDRVPRVSFWSGLTMLTPMVWDEAREEFVKVEGRVSDERE